MTRRNTIIFTLFVLVSGLLITATAAKNETTAPPSVVEAGFITKFPNFITWPDEPWKEEGVDFVVGVIGETPVYGNLVRIARYAAVDGSPMIVQRIDELGQINDCQVVFIASSEAERLDEILDYARELPVLTVAATEGFAERGVHINFYLVAEYVRFEINRKSCERANLSLSFRLMDVARMVESE